MDFIAKYLSNGMTLMVGTLLVLAIAYRYYSAFLAAKVLAIDPARTTPAHTLNDGQNYHPTNKWVLFGHHFAAISGAGPLIGPVLAAQFGYLPGLLWILIGVCLAGAVQDFTILVFSTRRKGQSLAQLAHATIGPTAGAAATIGILFVLIIALAGLGKVVTKALGGETITYREKTQFIAPEGAGFLYTPNTPASYRIPVGTRIIHPSGGQEVVGAQFWIESQTEGEVATDIDTHEPGKLVGSKLEVPAHNRTVRIIPGSTWGTFTITLTIPIALFVGWYIYRFRKGRVLEASIIGGILTLGAVYLGGMMDQGASAMGDTSQFVSFFGTFQEYFNLSEREIGIAMAIYGFVASILPVWFLLCPRDYLSSFLKIGTVLLLVVGVIIAHPQLHAPAINKTFLGGGPAFNGALFPFVFIVIMCGAISGFHALVSSGTTPKMISSEGHARTIGFGAMLIEGLVGIIALIAAAGLPSAHYYHIQTSIQDLPKYQQQIAQLAARDGEQAPPETMSTLVGENVQGRTGGAVTLAVGMANIFDTAARNILNLGSASLDKLEGMMKYWYHFAIMFEALFILTTIDTGTRVGRFLLQETLGKWVHPKLGQAHWWPSALLSTALIVLGWWYFLDANAMQAIWPMFGIANQMLAVMALAIASVGIAHLGRKQYLWVTIAPMCFVIMTTGTAAVIMLKNYFSNLTANNAIAAVCILAIVACTATVVAGAMMALRRPPREEPPENAGAAGAFPVATAMPEAGTDVEGG
jgi:carbon starvation protein